MQAQMKHDPGKTVWRFDRTHSTVEFSIRNFFFMTVKGRFKDLEGSIVLDEKSVSGSSVEATIGAASIDTGNKQRDVHLRAEDFLNVKNHGIIHFESAEVGPGRDRDMLLVKGALTIKDTSKEISLDVTEVDRSKSPGGEEVIYYVAETELNRHDFGINAWRGLIGPRLKVVINVQANRER